MNCVLLIALFAATTQPASRPATTQAARVGEYHATFIEQDPRSALEAQRKRHRVPMIAGEKYNLADESFEAYIPPDYNAANKYGIFVWISGGNRGQTPKGWRDLMDKHHLLFIAANNSGNERGIVVRLALAIDAVHNLQKIYNVDNSRIYVGGMSGGGKIASTVAVIYPEIFSGSLDIVGVGYFRNIPVPGDPTKFWPAVFTPPPAAMLDRARKNSRFVLITGTRDMNHDSIKAIYEQGFVRDNFAHVELVDVPDMGHILPPLEWIDRAIDTLDAPLTQPRGK